MNLQAWAAGYNKNDREAEPDKAESIPEALTRLPEAFEKGSKELSDDLAKDTVDKIPGWDNNKGLTDNIKGGLSDNFKVVTDAFGNAAKAASELGSSMFDGVKKYGPLVLAGGLAILLLRK
jgi:hypothetical protein